MKTSDVLCCSFQQWYKKFEKYTIPSVILPIPPEVMSYLQENGTLVLPEGSFAECQNSNENIENDFKDSDVTVAVAPNLDDFNQKIRHAITMLGGVAFPKLNWSSPKDASWISYNKSLQCSNPGDIYLLLKSSDFVSHDLTSPFKDCTDNSEIETEANLDYFLILRKWIEMNPPDEFRCFVRGRELIGISQREISQHFPSIHKEKENILDDILIFWEENIRNYFPLLSYTFDVYRPKDGQVILLDFGPYGPTTDSLMFSWEELTSDKSTYDNANGEVLECVDSNRATENCHRENIETDQQENIETDFRYISKATGVQPSPYMRYGLPVDIVDLSTGADPLKLVDFLQMKIQKEGESSSDEDDSHEQGRSSRNESSLSS